ncbi:MAG TPA: hypothetical protein VFR75_07320 [Solirubrobacterales bacterium]|nr:hypothetical protein [Solirubrobacterales bacterium]
MADPRDRELQRSPAARVLAERALVTLLDALEGQDAEIIVLGGLVPEVLVSGQDPPAPGHLGTTDVDILLVSHLTVDEDLGHVERGLKAIDFEPVEGGWRWRGRVDGKAVKMEFLCDLATAREHETIEIQGCDELRAQNLRGTGYVAEDWAWEPLTAMLPNGRETEIRARFAKLGGYLLSKLVAARTRGAAKDFYDLAYVLLHNRAGGPREAAAVLLAGDLRDSLAGLSGTLLEIRERFRVPNAIGPNGFAAQSRELYPDLDERELRADAVAAVGEFLDALSGGLPEAA